MNNVKLIYDKVKEIKIDILQKPIMIEVNREKFDSEALLYIVRRIKYLFKYSLMKLPIEIKLT